MTNVETTAIETAAIRIALARLDPSNENHWTGDGLPRLDALGLSPVPKRAEVTEAAPLFTRTNPEIPAEAPQPVAEPKVEDVKKEDDADFLVQAEAELAEAEAEVRTSQDEVTKAQRKVEVAQVKRDALLRKVEKARPANENILGIKAVLERNKQTRMEKAAIANQLKEVGVTEKLLRAGSPLDNAMRRKSGFGLSRPKLPAAIQGVGG